MTSRCTLAFVANLISLAISIAISFAGLIVGLAVLAALRARNVDPVGRVARVLSPQPTVTESLDGAAAAA